MVSTRLFTLLLCFVSLSVSESKVLEPHAAESFNVSLIQKLGTSCSYRVIISTSCSSSRYTRDQISIAFGDAYGNQIYSPRLDDPSIKTFEQCSSDTFEINGPCTYQLCYVYLYRSGPDGWIPESVKIHSHGSKSDVTFPYNTLVPESVWYGFNYCKSASDSSVLGAIGLERIVLVVVGFIVAGLILFL
ncbi:hypothetical protein BRARA_I00683 [Brassica rapa]|uniref:Embryo-specific protein ATS3B n=1 Tax=Brassica campestris TaxID=3711 RepID=A0A397XRX6_BRACM|nr:hypothetical protein BRARA_I00683 [Brassica rapa]CAG7860326.1 unnamed protein product [Brassica rapa]